MKVSDMGRHPPNLPQETEYSVTEIQVTPKQVEHPMREIKESKATGPDDVSVSSNIVQVSCQVLSRLAGCPG